MYSPKWSKAKKHLKSFTCSSLSDRIDFQLMNYRKAHDQLGRAVITVDKIEKLTMCTITAEQQEFLREDALRIERDDFLFDDTEHNLALQKDVHESLKNEAIYTQSDFFLYDRNLSQSDRVPLPNL